MIPSSKDPKTKIVATLGPASSTPDVLREMLLQGVDVCRLNFSHGSYEFYTEVISTIRSLNDELGLNTAILADLQGPKLRVGEMADGPILLKEGEELVITTENVKGTPGLVSTSYAQFPKDIKVGEMVLLDDGKLRLQVKHTDGKERVTTMIINGGMLSSNKGINLPNTKVSLPCLTTKDRADLDFALEQGVDWVGLSFVRSAKDIIRRCLLQHRPVIVATQMMESMIVSSTPTRAEVNDVANAVLDHADAVMLSAETSVGKYPVEVVKAMNKILLEMEKSDTMYNVKEAELGDHDRMVTDTICTASVRMAAGINIKAIVTMTHSGYTAFKISSMRPKAHIFAFTSNKRILNMLNLVWGVRAEYYDKTVSTDHTIADIKHILRRKALVDKGDLVVNIASMPIAEQGMANMIKLSAV
jgi:pyruvate kinase